MEIVAYGEEGVLLKFGDEINKTIHAQVKYYYEYLQTLVFQGVISIIPAYNSIVFTYNKQVISFHDLKLLLHKQDENTILIPKKPSIIEIPVCYDEKLALDMSYIQSYTQLSKQEIIQKHTTPDYLVYMIGFTPCFMYLGGMDIALRVPRKKEPRLILPSGAVGIADQQTGVYPLSTPGGWQIVGQTPKTIFSVEKPVVNMGDIIKFKSITLAEYEEYTKAKSH